MTVDSPVLEYAETSMENLCEVSECTNYHGVSPSGEGIRALHGDKATGINYASLI